MSHEPLIIFGGTFDPIHSAHIAIAKAIYAKFKIPITFLPTGIPPHKAAPLTTDQDRLAMLKLAIGGVPYFKLDECEINSREFCYTYLTLRNIRKKIGNNTPLFFFIGSDSLESLNTWDNWLELFSLTNFILITRPGYLLQNLEHNLKREVEARLTTDISKPYSTHGKIYQIASFEPMDISSTETRINVEKQKPICDLVPQVVLQYIKQHNLYQK